MKQCKGCYYFNNEGEPWGTCESPSANAARAMMHGEQAKVHEHYGCVFYQWETPTFIQEKNALYERAGERRR